MLIGIENGLIHVLRPKWGKLESIEIGINQLVTETIPIKNTLFSKLTYWFVYLFLRSILYRTNWYYNIPYKKNISYWELPKHYIRLMNKNIKLYNNSSDISIASIYGEMYNEIPNLLLLRYFWIITFKDKDGNYNYWTAHLSGCKRDLTDVDKVYMVSTWLPFKKEINGVDLPRKEIKPSDEFFLYNHMEAIATIRRMWFPILRLMIKSVYL